MLKLIFKNNKYSPAELNKKRISIGRDKSNDIVLIEEDISGFHAEIHTEDENSFLVDSGSSNGTFVNGVHVDKKHKLKPWDIVRFGKTQAEIIDPEKRRPTTLHKAIDDVSQKQADIPANGWSLKGLSDPVKNKVFPINKDMVLGRDKDCDIVISSEMISRQHAKIVFLENNLSIQDMKSSNFTYVNEKKISSLALKDGDVIKLDKISFKVQNNLSDINKTKLRPAIDINKTALRDSIDKTKTMPVSDSNKNALLIGQDDFSGKKFFLTTHKTTIGRTPGNIIIIDETAVSASHAKITLANGDWKLEDTDSTNGTFVNDKKITEQILENGDIICFGKTKFKFEDNQKKKTQMIESLDGRTHTSVSSAVKKRLPAWIYGLIGFLIVGISLTIFLILKNDNSIANADLQGSSIWSQSLPQARTNPATPVIANINDDKMLDVIIADASGFITALDGEKGLKIFESEVMDKILAAPVAVDLTKDGIDEIIVASNNGIVSAFNGSGKLLWRSASNLDLGEIINRPAIEDVNNDKVLDIIVPTANKGLVALDGSHGWEIWNTKAITKGRIITAPVKADFNEDGIIDFLFASESGHICAITSQQKKVWKLWEADLPLLDYSSPLFFKAGKQSLIVIFTKEKGIAALNAKTGRIVWNKAISKRFFASPVASDSNDDNINDVIAVAANGDIHVFDGATGDEIWSVATGAAVLAAPCLFDFNNDGLKDLIILDTKGGLHCIDINRGRTELSVKITGADSFFASPVLADINNDGFLNIIIAAKNGQITAYFLNRKTGKNKKVWPVFLGSI